ncbi:hypothetical protein HID58_006570 [Brassica napus]|uniref:Uncharacterized protein n=1 Tax=Brassica napus TaxID=3708 RepID=A0ABQ8EBR7_BRANA|nr:hypothetical protein HID58_006570 [Brassica napus]
MTPELHGLIATLRRGNPRWLAFTVDQIGAAYALAPGENRATPTGLAAPVRLEKGRRNKRAREREVLPNRPGESSEPGPVSIAVPVGTSQVDPSAHLLEVHETSSCRFLYDNEGAVEIEGLKGKLRAVETEKVAVQNDLHSMKEKHRREIKVRDAETRKECDLAPPSLAREYDAVLTMVKDKLQKKKKETAAEICLQEEVSLDVDYGLALVSDPSLSRLELPEVSGDSVNQD